MNGQSETTQINPFYNYNLFNLFKFFVFETAVSNTAAE